MINSANLLTPQEIIHQIISSNGNFPNNSRFPLLIYKIALKLANQSAEDVQEHLDQNGWNKSWINSIYDFHHYHSNTHEVLVIFAGNCTIEIGGEKGHKYDIAKGDVVILPVGVSHRQISSSEDFKCVGAYPFNVQYDMNYGREEEYQKSAEKIKEIGLPATDPIFGKNGILFDYWK